MGSLLPLVAQSFPSHAYPTHYKNIEHLKLQFQQQLNQLIEAGQI